MAFINDDAVKPFGRTEAMDEAQKHAGDGGFRRHQHQRSCVGRLTGIPDVTQDGQGAATLVDAKRQQKRSCSARLNRRDRINAAIINCYPLYKRTRCDRLQGFGTSGEGFWRDCAACCASSIKVVLVRVGPITIALSSLSPSPHTIISPRFSEPPRTLTCRWSWGWNSFGITLR